MDKLRQALELIEQLKAILDTMDLPDRFDDNLSDLREALEGRLQRREKEMLDTIEKKVYTR